MVSALTVAALLCACGGAAAITSPSPTRSVQNLEHAVIAWTSCGEQLDCASVQVPLDWARAHGPKISLAVIRHRATQPKQRIGSLFVNFGGPGVAGVDAVRKGGAFLDRLGAGRFDVVGWDPRGTGASTHVRCFPNEQSMAKFWGEDWTIPATPSESSLYVSKTIAYTRTCTTMSGELLEHVSTADTVRDLDYLRELVGDPQLNYRGLSYGTFIGQTYVNMFPRRVRAMVLDANIDPVAFTTSVQTFLANSGADTNVVFEKFLAMCQQAGPARCALASHPAALRVRTLLTELRQHPIRAPSAPVPQQLRYGEALIGIWLALGQPADWPLLAARLNKAADGDGSSLAIAVRNSRHNLQQALVPAVALQCADKPLPQPGAVFAWRNVIDKLTARDFLGSVEGWWLWAPCASWQAASLGRYAGPWNAASANPILIIGNRYDPRTTFAGSLLVSRQLGNAALLTLDGYGHTSDADPSACINEAVTAYFVTLVTPPHGTICEPDRAPFDPGFGANDSAKF